MFCLFNHTLESSPVFDSFVLSIGLEVSATIFVLPILWVFSDIDKFWVFIPYSFSIASEQLNNLFKDFSTLNILCIKSLNGFH